MSSLALQLAQGASLNAALLVDRSRRKSVESYLFTGREADQHDLESIYALGVNGFLQLASLEPSLQKFGETLFSEHAKSTDRTLISSEANMELDTSITACLSLLGPFLMETPTGKVLEWLVRRFRINVFNIEAVLSLFLPYHESPHFTKMISIMHIKPNSSWSFLLPFKSAAQNLPRMSLVTEMLRNTDISRFVTSLLPTAIKGGYSHRVLLVFNAACLHDFITRSTQLDEGTMAYILPALLEPLQQASVGKDAVLGTYILLSVLSQKCKVTPAALNTILGAMAGCADRVSTRQFTNAALSVCEPQDELERMSSATFKAIMRITNVEDEFRNACAWIGVEKLLNPILPGLIKRLSDQRMLSMLEVIVTAPKVPAAVVRQSTILLMDLVIPTDGNPSASGLLAVIQQRHPSTFHQVVDELGKRDEIDQEALEQLRISLSVVQAIPQAASPGHQDRVDMVLASANSDPKVRAAAVNNLLTILTRKDQLPPPELESLHSALLGRVQDTNQAIVDVLYSRPQAILPILNKNAGTYIDNLSGVLCAPGSKPKRSLLRAHLAFLSTHFIPENTGSFEDVFQRIIFPFLLFSKPRQRTAEVGWDIISSHSQTSQNSAAPHEWLVGCASIIREEKQKVGLGDVEMMSNLNLALSSQIALNIMRSDNYVVHLEALIAKLHEPNPYAKVFGYMIIRSLLGQLSGEHQIDAAHRVLDVVRSEGLIEVEDLPEADENPLEIINSMTLGRVVGRPSSKNTVQWLQIAIISMIPTIPRPVGVILNWLANSSSNASEYRGSRFVELFRSVYRLANVPTSAPSLTTSILQALFISLKDDALAFLAGIWVGSVQGIREDSELRTLALHHASAFLQAHIAEDDGIDFQTILPSLLVALQSRDTERRQIALTCLSHLRLLADKKFSTVYGFDTIYGKGTSQLQYLDQEDFKKYLAGLMDHGDHLIHDVEYIRLFHQQHLGQNKSDKKRDHEYKHRIICFIASHINAYAFPVVQVTLLKTIDTVSDSAKVQLLLPMIKMLVVSIAETGKTPLQELVTLAFSCFDVSVAKDLNNADGEIWELFVAVLQCAFTSGQKEGSPVLTPVVSRALQQGLFAALNLERKIAVLNLLLEFGSQSADNYTTCKQLLGNLVEEIPVIVHILDSLQPASTIGSPRAPKKAKTTYTPEDVLPRLSLFAEVLGSKPLPGSLDLVSHLLETLNRVLQSISAPQADVSYIEQLLMSAIENAANKISETPNLSPSAIRLDVLVELIRVADNPQTFHQALLLMANLARLAPDSVLHNVMPIFTFMGSNVFHRDDTYSFKVVQQTIDSIVPVMVSSLKRTHANPLDLYNASKEFLKVFTDAATHIPRHRRVNFFAHLVDVLGPEDFLPPICMLLVEKVSNRIIRQNPDDVQSYLSLPCSVFEHFSPPLQIRTLTSTLLESQRLADRVAHPKSSYPVFLDVSNDDTKISAMTVLRRRAQALIIFVGHALKPPEPGVPLSPSHEEEIGQLVSALISLTNFQGAEGKVDDITLAARSSLNRALSVMLASDFVNSSLLLIQSDEPVIRSGALDLLSERLPNITAKSRQEVVPVIVNIIGIIRDLLKTQSDKAATLSGFSSLRAIGLTLCQGEESSLMETIPLLLAAVKGRTMAAPAMTVLSPLPMKLGPRLIPYFREMISQSVNIIQDETSGPGIVGDAHSVLRGLLLSIPTFWGSGELRQVIKLYVDQYTATSSTSFVPISSLAKALAKKVPSKVLLPAMIDTWPSIQVVPRLERFVAYFDMLSRVLHSAARPTILEQLRSLFKVFLESFDMAKAGDNLDVERRAIAAFKELIVKLNEAAFRPLFRRLYDWAFASETDDIGKKITFCHIYIALLDFFKGLMNPYMSFLLGPFTETLKAFSMGSSDNTTYWTGIAEIITKSFTFDDGAFWRDDKLRQLASPLIKQVPVCLNSAEGKSVLQDCLGALVDVVNDDMLLKAINLELLMYTRSENTRLRLFALTCSEKLWRMHGGKLLGFAAETMTFIVECSEDENDMVVKESFKLKNAVENVAGNVDGL